MLVLIGGIKSLGVEVGKILSLHKVRFALCTSLSSATESEIAALSHCQPDFFIPLGEIDAFFSEHQKEIQSVVYLSALDIPEHATPEAAIQTVLHTSQKLWNWCATYNASFIYLSSAQTYDGIHNRFNDGFCIQTLEAMKPQSVIGWASHLMDLWVTRMLLRKDTLHPPQCVGLKLFNMYGFADRQLYSLIHSIKNNLENNTPPSLWKTDTPHTEDGGFVRHFLHVSDAANVIKWLLDNPKISTLINVAPLEALSQHDAASIVAEHLGLPTPVDYSYVPAPKNVNSMFLERPNTQRLISLGFNVPFLPLKKGLSTLT